MVIHPAEFYVVPESQYLPVIASLEPVEVTVSRDGVDILTKPFLDGGWGYFVPRSARYRPNFPQRYSDLGEGVYWYHPY
jgi:hypothetical protein